MTLRHRVHFSLQIEMPIWVWSRSGQQGLARHVRASCNPVQPYATGLLQSYAA